MTTSVYDAVMVVIHCTLARNYKLLPPLPHRPTHLVACSVTVHLVHTDDQLLHTQQVDQAGVLAGLALHLTGLVVTLLDGGSEVTVGGHHEQAHIGLGSAGNHVLDEIPVACTAQRKGGGDRGRVSS